MSLEPSTGTQSIDYMETQYHGFIEEPEEDCGVDPEKLQALAEELFEYVKHSDTEEYVFDLLESEEHQGKLEGLTHTELEDLNHYIADLIGVRR